MVLRTRKKSSLYGKCIRVDGKEIKESEIYNTKGTCQSVRIIGVSVLSGLPDMKSSRDACFIDELRQTLSRQENV